MTPERPIFNPPGRPQLSYRVGTYESFLTEILSRLPRQRLPDGPYRGERPLARLDTDPQGSWIVALADAWAAVGDVLTFYQERIANEGFLGTALEDLSVYELIRLLGYPARPALGAASYLAFTVADTRGMPEVVDVPRGARIQSIPVGGRLPQIWEVSSAFPARAEWNQMLPAIAERTVRPPILGGATAVLLAGAKSRLKPGAAILLMGELGSTGPRRWLRMAEKVEVVKVGGGAAAGNGGSGSAAGAAAPGKGASGNGGASTRGGGSESGDASTSGKVDAAVPVEPKPGTTVAHERGSAAALRYAARAAAYAARLKRPASAGAAPGAGSAGTSAATRVSWSDPLAPENETTRLERPQAFVLKQQAYLFGYNATPWDELTLETQREEREILGGVRVSGDGGKTWQGRNQDLPATDVSVLYAGAFLFAGTKKGLYRSAGGGAWEALTQGIGSADVRALASDPEGHLFAGTSDGRVLRSTDGGGTWEALGPAPEPRSGGHRGPRQLAQAAAKDAKGLIPGRSRPQKLSRLPKGVIHALLFTSGGNAGQLLVGTGAGVYSIGEDGDGWWALNQGLPGTDPKTGAGSLVVAALASAGGALWAATEKGAFRAERWGSAWKAANEGFPDVDSETGQAKVKVEALLPVTDRRTRRAYLYAGTDHGVYRRPATGGRWRPWSLGLPQTDARTGASKTAVTALAADADAVSLKTRLYAGTAGGLYASESEGGGWIFLDTGQPSQKVEALAAGSGEVEVAMPFDGFAVEEWPGFAIEPGQVDLSTVHRQAAGGWVALRETADDGSERTVVTRVTDAATVRREDFGLTAIVTRLEVEPDPRLAELDLRRTIVYCESEALELWSEERPVLEPLDPTRFELTDALDPPLDAQRPLLVTGRPIRASFAPGAFPLELETSGGGRETLELTAGNDFQVLASPSGTSVLVLEVRTLQGVEGTVRVAADEVVWRPAEDDDEVVGQATFVAGVEPPRSSGGGSWLTVDPALAAAFDPQATVVYGNVGHVTQGESVTEILGSGDATTANQSFALSRSPLTYLPAPTESGTRSTLEVRVGGLLWRQADSFDDARPGDRVYVVRRDLAGAALVTFGDGRRGARLPTGSNNVAAAYRTGVWSEALEPGQLSLLRTKPLGLKAATNPLATPAGTPAETLDEIRLRAPRMTRPLGRIVSYGDFEDFVLTYPGISRARAAELATGAGTVVQVTVAGLDGAAVEPDGDVYQQLVAAVEASRVPGLQVLIQSYADVPFTVAARLRPAPDEVPANVEARVRDALLDRYSFANSRWGERITSSQVLTAIQEVEGVVEVELRAFYRTGAGTALEEAIAARPARVVQPAEARPAERVLPAELLVIDADALDLELVGSGTGGEAADGGAA